MSEVLAAAGAELAQIPGEVLIKSQPPGFLEGTSEPVAEGQVAVDREPDALSQGLGWAGWLAAVCASVHGPCPSLTPSAG